ncbi:MAG TPA: AsmA-like C-terminal region-containing protein [Microvirga sp.]|jgi:AsmA protein|nr:AsmA-like C-terminal region-containing protein [Microvirga sp.]
MSRRVVLLIALIALAVFGGATAPWTLTGSGLSTAVADHMKSRYGLDFTSQGRSTFAVLPIPRVKLEGITLRAPDGALKAEGGTLRGELNLLPLLVGRIELAELTLSDTRITGSYQALQSLKWNDLFANRLDSTFARRLILARSSIQWTDLQDAALEQVNLVATWTGGEAPLQVAGSVLWREERVLVEQASVSPALLASNQFSPVSLTLSAPSGRALMAGEAKLGDDPQFAGESTIEAKSVRDFTQWSGMKLPFGPLVEALSVTGDVSINRRRLTWPSVAVTLGADKLEGTLAVRFDTDRPLISGTLAADKLNLSGLFEPFTQARTASGEWNEDDIDLAHTTGSSLDLRLSAATARIGRLRLDDMAASVLVRPGRIEASIGRADFNKGTLKGRLSLATLNGMLDFKSQGAFAGVDMATFLNAIGEPRWITGQAQGQFQMEGSGQNVAAVIRDAQGRSSVTVKDGELIGISLDDALRRVEKRPLLASLNWKGGRTPFNQAQAQIVLKNGIGEVTESRLTAPALQTNLQGRVSLVDRTLDLRADVSAGTSALPDPAPALVFDVSGGWDSVVVAPDARSLIERSGAAKPLLGPDRLPPGSNPPPTASAH